MLRKQSISGLTLTWSRRKGLHCFFFSFECSHWRRRKQHTKDRHQVAYPNKHSQWRHLWARQHFFGIGDRESPHLYQKPHRSGVLIRAWMIQTGKWNEVSTSKIHSVGICVLIPVECQLQLQHDTRSWCYQTSSRERQYWIVAGVFPCHTDDLWWYS